MRRPTGRRITMSVGRLSMGVPHMDERPRMIEVNGLTCTRDMPSDDGQSLRAVNVLNDVNLVVREGEFLGVLGRNGSGKSTLAMHLNALMLPTSGDVIVDGLNTKDHERIWDIRSNVALVFQDPDRQMIATTVEEEVAFGPENLCCSPVESRRRVAECLRMVGMESFESASPSRLSGGQKQRVVIAAALAMQPRYLVLDEPTAMLDPAGRKELMGALDKVRSGRSPSIVYITHHMDELVGADRIIVLDDGRVAMEGTPREVYSSSERLTAMGLDVPPVTQIADGLREGGLHVPKGVLTRDELVSALCRLG